MLCMQYATAAYRPQNRASRGKCLSSSLEAAAAAAAVHVKKIYGSADEGGSTFGIKLTAVNARTATYLQQHCDLGQARPTSVRCATLVCSAIRGEMWSYMGISLAKIQAKAGGLTRWPVSLSLTRGRSRRGSGRCILELPTCITSD